MAGILRICHQINEEAAHIVYGQHQFAFHDPAQALEWLHTIGTRNQAYVHYIALAGVFLPDGLRQSERDTQASMWASFLGQLPQLRGLRCVPQWVVKDLKYVCPDIIWNHNAVVEAVRKLTHLRAMSLSPISSQEVLEVPMFFGEWKDTGTSRPFRSTLRLTMDKPRLVRLQLEAEPGTANGWAVEDYFHHLQALKYLCIRESLGTDLGGITVSGDFFGHVAPLHGFEWHGTFFTLNHVVPFTARHGATLRFLDIKTPFINSWTISQQVSYIEAFRKLFQGLPVLEVLRLDKRGYGCRIPSIIESLPPSIKIFDINLDNTTQAAVAALRALPSQCPRLKHVRVCLGLDLRIYQYLPSLLGEYHRALHAAFEILSRQIEDTCFPNALSVGVTHQNPLTGPRK